MQSVWKLFHKDMLMAKSAKGKNILIDKKLIKKVSRTWDSGITLA